MRTPSKIITALALARLAVAGGAAFTATGLSTSGSAAHNQFVGGVISQDVTGATLNSIVYGYDLVDQTKVTSIQLNFVSALPDSSLVSAKAIHSTTSGALVTVGTFTASTDKTQWNISLATGLTELTKLEVTVNDHQLATSNTPSAAVAPTTKS